jgi:hypothetical protein
LVDRLHETQVVLLPSTGTLTVEELRGQFPSGPLYACDFYIRGAESWDDVPGGYRHDGIVNVDHHAPTPRMARRVSSTNLALDLVRHQGPAQPRVPVAIHHTDCDSVLSAAIVAGVLPADDHFGAAAIAADHTGQADPIADLLQAIGKQRDLTLSLENLDRLMRGRDLEPEARDLLREREAERQTVQKLVENGRFRHEEGLSWAIVDETVDAALLPPLLPDARLIALFQSAPVGWLVKLRLGLAAPEGATLNAMRVSDFDPHYGGRWNAGANIRSGGIPEGPNTYVAFLLSRIDKLK